MTHTINISTLRELASLEELSVLSVTDASALSDQVKSLSHWQEQGYGADMQYMLKAPDLLTSITRLSPTAQSVVSFALFYQQLGTEPLKPGFGRVARYAWGRDYHRVIKRKMIKLVKRVEQELGIQINSRALCDAAPLLERAIAKRAGLGFQGKNTMLIRPGEGSFFLISQIIWDLEISGVSKQVGTTGKCGSCQRCLKACPTGALVNPYQLDARRCISYLTIEKEGNFNSWESQALGEWVMGCDICQEVCPFNYRALKEGRLAATKAFEETQGVGREINLELLLGIRSDQEFCTRFQGTALMRPGREGMLRNAAAVACNTRAFFLLPSLELAAFEDSSVVIRRQAFMSLVELIKTSNDSSQARISQVYKRARKDPGLEDLISAIFLQ